MTRIGHICRSICKAHAKSFLLNRSGIFSLYFTTRDNLYKSSSYTKKRKKKKNCAKNYIELPSTFLIHEILPKRSHYVQVKVVYAKLITRVSYIERCTQVEYLSQSWRVTMERRTWRYVKGGGGRGRVHENMEKEDKVYQCEREKKWGRRKRKSTWRYVKGGTRKRTWAGWANRFTSGAAKVSASSPLLPPSSSSFGLVWRYFTFAIVSP